MSCGCKDCKDLRELRERVIIAAKFNRAATLAWTDEGMSRESVERFRRAMQAEAEAVDALLRAERHILPGHFYL